MTPRDFVIWFKGFVEASNTYNITPKQWDAICEELDKVEVDKQTYTYGTITTTPGYTGTVTMKNDCYTTNTVF